MRFLTPMLLISMAWSPGLAQAQLTNSVPAVVVYVQGTVRVIKPNGALVDAALGTEVAESDTVATEDASQVRLRLYDRSLIRLGPNSKAQMAQLRYDGAAEKKEVSVKLVLGRLWASVSRLVSSDSRFEVQANNAVAGVRGTQLLVEQPAGGPTSVKVLEGKVAVRDASGNTTMALAGSGVDVVNGRNQTPTQLSFNEIQRIRVEATAMQSTQGEEHHERAAEGLQGQLRTVENQAREAAKDLRETRRDQGGGEGGQHPERTVLERVSTQRAERVIENIARDRQFTKAAEEATTGPSGDQTRLRATIDVKER